MAASPPSIRRISRRWRDSILVCRKCSKKISGGFGPKGKTRLDKALREELGIGKGKRAELGVMLVGCFDICPKNAVIVARGTTPETLYSIRQGTPIAEVVEGIGLEGCRKKRDKPDEE